MREVYEPRLTYYQTWGMKWMLRVDLSAPRLLNGHNILLLDDKELAEVMELVSNNVTVRSGNKFDALNTRLCRIDYAVNLIHQEMSPKAILAHYSRLELPWLHRKTEGYDETVYFSNNSRALKIYIKPIEVSVKHGEDSPLIEVAKGIVRMELSLPDKTAVDRYARRKHLSDTTAKTMCSRKSINIAVAEMRELLKWEKLDDGRQPRIKTLFERTKDMSLAERLDGFLNSEKAFGKKYYLDKSLGVSKSTYDRHRRECRKIGF
jgi:II/X family phage/plasmid replication protein